MRDRQLPAKAQDALTQVMNADLAAAEFTLCLASSPETGDPEYLRLNVTDAVRLRARP